MTTLFALQCPTCGASLQITGESDQFHCEHCGNRYLLDHKVSEMDEPARKHLTPVVTYTQTTGQWLRIAEYDLILHGIENSMIADRRVFYIQVEYENKASGPIKYRHDQWVIFGRDGCSLEPVKDFTHPHLYSDEKIYLGMTRVLNPGMHLRGWLAFVLPPALTVEYLQFSGGTPVRTAEFRISG